MLGIDEGGGASLALHIGDGVQGQGGFATGFRAIDFNNSTARVATNTQANIEGEGSRGDRRHVFDEGLAFFEAHDRALAELFFDRADREFKGLGFFLSVLIFGHDSRDFVEATVWVDGLGTSGLPGLHGRGCAKTERGPGARWGAAMQRRCET